MQKIMFNDRYGLTEAVLEGRKTMTRRIVPARILEDCVIVGEVLLKSTYKIGEVVAVAQDYYTIEHSEVPSFLYLGGKEAGVFNKMFVKAEFMPHQIRITDVDVERLQEISDEDCLKEGIRKGEFYNTFDEYYVPNLQDYLTARTPKKLFEKLIDKVSGKGTWNSNPWVFVYSFELIR